MNLLKASYSVAELTAMLGDGWYPKKTLRWLRRRGVKLVQAGPGKFEVPLAELLAADDGLWESLLMRLRLTEAGK